MQASGERMHLEGTVHPACCFLHAQGIVAASLRALGAAGERGAAVAGSSGPGGGRVAGLRHEHVCLHGHTTASETWLHGCMAAHDCLDS